MTISPTVRRVADRIVATFRPERVILFGSHASGTADPGSDIDLLVVMDTAEPVHRQAVTIYRSLSHDVPIDILVRTPAQVARRDPRDLILRTILDEGITLHEPRD